MIPRVDVGDAFLQFESLWLAVLLIPLLLAVVIGVLRRQPSLRVSSIRHYQISGGWSRMMSPLHIPLLLEALGILLLIVALMRPQKGIEETIVRTEGIDIMLALDISGSMDSYDLPPHISDQGKALRMIARGDLRPRVEVAKDEVRRFIDNRPNDRIGLLAFAGVTYTVCPPTLDHAFLKSHLERLDAGILTDGTGIAAPISTATYRLKESKAKRRVTVLFTDGANTVDARVKPRQAARLAATFDVIVHTVGIGSKRAAVLSQGLFGRQRLSHTQMSFDRPLLEDIARETQGQYFAAEDAEGLRRVINEINELETIEIEQPRYVDYKELYKAWLVGGLVLILLGFVAEHTLFLKVP